MKEGAAGIKSAAKDLVEFTTRRSTRCILKRKTRLQPAGELHPRLKSFRMKFEMLPGTSRDFGIV